MSHFFIYPGHLLATAEPSLIRTILGSCVGVALWDETTGIGGLCHYLLPSTQDGPGNSGRYGEYAIRELLTQCLDLGANRSSTYAKIYGGGAVVSTLSGTKMDIGVRNIECARRLLKVLNVKVVHESVGGEKGRKISLDTATGDVVENISGQEAGQNLSGSVVAEALSLTKVLIVDDSATIRTILQKVFEKSKKLVVVGTAVDPFDARDKIIKLNPDVITLDIEMPRMNGITFLEKLMVSHPLPVVIVSSLASNGAAAERALELGAIEFVHKPSQFDPMVLSELADQLIPKVLAAASVDVTKKSQPAKPAKTVGSSSKKAASAPISLIVVGGNGGAVDALDKLINGLATDTPPVVVSISTVSGFAATWVTKLATKNRLPVNVEVVKESIFLRQGHVYIASEGHLEVVEEHGRLKVQILNSPPSSGQRPSADILFKSAAETCGATTIGVLLSGYGRDGVDGISDIKEKGGWSICQAPADCSFNNNVVLAIDDGLADDVVDRNEIAQKIYARRSSSLSS
jgi:two-component system, chemotaxis family, protein-glutamate methylesterase/glutaminase